ncbi:ABC transporter substrate-binding protein [Thauera terpenica 58Eu]|jgi:NitT/TauT family transport system substrate-binding protein|uniref:ABC transporter substrate-binding protein n=1 Tax=Thauera terpenica 58Eu TaxID=1348657 RepID=T0ATP9_9RHOO|nr:PhnD/SsuA/transferrin family substrate-binding protein [Thauera terpenica]EPZ14028.1 ABC transporter substrate-binding protein [Thauera terpenica 58Eu]MBP6726546.1 ABC transporter substrate-binding protein [Thauera sp.]MBP6761354.1 ABC transporter substrate-binding protein [Thauera sp.]
MQSPRPPLPSWSRFVLHACVVLAFLIVTGTADAQKLPKLTLAGPPASVSNPLIHMVDSGALADVAERVEFVLWRDPDQLRVMALDGRADVLAMPTNVAANLHNRGAKLQLLNVSTWGVLWLVSRDPTLKSLADLRGKELAVPFRGDMPDIVFQLLAEQQGVDLRKDVQLRYVASPIDAMQLLVMRRVDHALLAEPAVSMALRKTGSFPLSVIAPELHRSVDLQQEWGRVFARSARIPQAGIAVMGALRERPDVVARIEAEYARSLAWCRDHAEACGQGVAARIDMLSAEAVADSIAVSQMDAVPAHAARAELEFMFGQLMKKSPALIGGKLPDDGFYGGAGAQ